MSKMDSWIKGNAERKRVFAEEYLIALVAEEIHDALDQANGLSRSDLAQALGKSKAYVSQVLSGSRNMTLRTLADFALALGRVPELKLRLPESESKWETLPDVRMVQRRYSAPLNYECMNEQDFYPANEQVAV